MLHKPTLKVNYIKQIRRVRDLPSWYCKEKYEKTKSLTGIGWYEQLHIRLMSLYSFQIEELQNNILETNRTDEKSKINFRNSLRIVRESPIVDIEKNRQLWPFFRSETNGILKNTATNIEHQCLAAHPTTVRELYRIESTIAKLRGDGARNHYTEAYSHTGFYTPKYKHELWFNSTIGDVLSEINSRELLLTINLAQPDTAILDQLKKMLPKIRDITKAAHPGERYRSISPEELAKYSVLPFLDLHIWEIENKIKITDSVMTDAIYPAGDKFDVGTLKTTRSLANRILTHERLNNLAGQEAVESAL